MLRLYWPKETPPSVFDCTWSPPAVKLLARISHKSQVHQGSE
jgi:hypothetical protein